MENTTLFNVQNLEIGEIENDSLEDENLKTMTRLFMSKMITCVCTHVIKTVSCITYDFEIFSFDITFEKIKKLEKTLSMFLRKEGVLISPSKTNAGFVVSVPHSEKMKINLGNCLNMQKTSSFSIPLGLDEQNNLVIADIKKLPHLLISGSTGSGKSVCMNGIISSIISQCSPKDVQLLLIDPKQVEFSIYDNLKYYLASPVITNPYRASEALYTVCYNMDKRYREISKTGCRDIDEYNNKVDASRRYNRMIIIIDELADLMLKCKKEVESFLVRIAQLGRACGVHLIVATQRPSREVVTGLLKVNIPAKICFKVPNSVNSRVILDRSGGEKLTGNGDGLFLNSDGSDVIRFQGAFVSTEEIENLIQHVNSTALKDKI